MNRLIAQRARLLTPLLLTLTTLLFLAPALRPGYRLLAADLPYLFDPLWQPLAPPGALEQANPIIADQFYQFHPWYQMAWAMLQRGEIPAWNPAINGGQPLYGNGLAGIFSLFNLVANLFPVARFELVSALLRLWLAGGSTYLYGRTIGLSRPAAWLAMLTFAFSGPFIAWLWGTPSHALAWLPVLLWLGEKLLRTRTLPWALGAAGALALLLYSAQPEVAFQVGVVWGLYLLTRATWREGTLGLALRRHAPWWALILVIGLGLAALEVLGFVDALRHSIIWHHRQAGEDVDLIQRVQRVFFTWQEWPTLVTTLLPHFLGREADDSYWYPFGNTVENNAYAGVLPLLLALLALWRAWRDKALPVRRWLWLWGAFAGGTLAIATVLPVAAVLQEVPPFSLTLLGRLRGIYVFAVAILAGFGLDLLLQHRSLRRPLLALLLGATAVNLLLVVLFYMGFTLYADELIASGRAFIERHAGSPILNRPLEELYALVETRQQAKLAMLRPTNPVMYLPLLITFATALLFRLERSGYLAPVTLIAALVLLTWLDLWWVGKDINRAVPATWLEPTPPALGYLHAQPEPFRVVATHQILNPNMSMLTHLEDVRGYDALASHRYRNLLAGLDGFAPIGYHHYFLHLDDPQLDRLGATYGLSATPPDDPRWEAVFTDPSGVTVYRSRSALPRAYLVDQAEIVENADASLVRSLAPEFDARHSVVLEQMPEGWIDDAAPSDGTGTVEFTQRAATHLELQVNTPRPALLVLLDTYAPGWRATVDQQPTPVHVANHAFRAIVVPAGEHVVTFSYAPTGLRWGAWITAATAAIFIVLVAWSTWTHHTLKKRAA